jgi:signal transduction histidine kinase/ActR/RegA family two-component response regulator
LTRINRDGVILKYVGKELLGNIAEDFLDLLETSSVVYEQNGDYAFGIFASGWCRMMDRASRDLCNTPDNVQALNSGRWLCHESCWTDCAKKAIAGGVAVDIECNGGIRLYSEPIYAGEEVMGVINFGYGDPPREPEKLIQLADTYGLSYDELKRESHAYDSRPKYIIELAKSRLRASAQLIGSLVEARMAHEEREKLQSQLLQAQKMESVGLLAGGIAHDFNNLLHAMGGNLDLLDMKIPEDHPGKKRILTIRKSIDRAAGLVEQMLLFSRKADIKKQALDLNLEIKDSTRIMERSIPRMVEIELFPDDGAWPVSADPIQVEQVLFNLGTNAADAMPEGGRLIIETANITLDQDFVRTHAEAKPGRYVLMSVSDTGCGMDSETIKHVFDPFFTTKQPGKGTGLGMSSVYGIIKAHEGYITCYSELGKGTTFRVYWPAIPEIDVRENEIEVKTTPVGGGETILVVDDDDQIRELTEEALQDYGYKTLSADSGEQALDIFKEKAKDIDLVLMDLNMPGMGGSQCTRKMVTLDPSVRVLVASGYAANGHGKAALEFGAKDFISKPFQAQKLLAKVRQVLDAG